MPRATRIKVEVTEPTMSAGIWSLAQFDWWGRIGISREDIEELPAPAIGSVTMFLTESCNELRLHFDEWLDPLPKVARWKGTFKVSQARDFLTDWVVIEGRASGWFELSDDTVRTEKLLAIVSTDGQLHHQLLWHEDWRTTIGGARDREESTESLIARMDEAQLRVDHPDYWQALNRRLSARATGCTHITLLA